MNVKQLWVLVSLVAVVVLFYDNFCFAKNITPSLPQKYWLIAKGKTPKRGNYICFTLSEETAKKNNLPSSIKFTKQVIGVEGDNITLKNRDFYINDKYVATAKTHSLKGEPLTPSSEGVLGKGQYYVFTPHKDSFDSRYQKMGWVNQEQIIGVAYPLW